MMGTPALPRYKCHKEVSALKIADIQLRGGETYAGDLKAEFASMTGELWLHPADPAYAPFQPSVQWREAWQRKAEVGGYWVVYDDGYTSYSPAAPFEAGYSLVDA